MTHDFCFVESPRIRDGFTDLFYFSEIAGAIRYQGTFSIVVLKKQ